MVGIRINFSGLVLPQINIVKNESKLYILLQLYPYATFYEKQIKTRFVYQRE